MATFEIIKCHGSGNDFIMIDITHDASLHQVDWSEFARIACNRLSGIGSDGILLVVKNNDGIYGMDMLNPDGTHAEMCGNGIRAVARLAAERGYLDSGILTSGGRQFKAQRQGEIAKNIEAFSVEIPIGLWSPSFAFYDSNESFIDKKIEALDSNLRFTALNLGNPHVVAEVESIDMTLLERLGKRVTTLTDVFPHGVNVSLYECQSPTSIFVATYERGAGITMSCGTAMTASATAAALRNRIAKGERIDVFNRGGKVACQTKITAEGVTTILEGNATFEWWGKATFCGNTFSYAIERITGEAEAWERFVESLNN